MDKENFDLKSGDSFEFVGQVMGIENGENSFGGSITAQTIAVTEYSPLSYKDAFSPTITDRTIDQTIDQHGFKVALEKIEFAKKETRLYLKAENSNESKMSLSIYSAKIIQDGKQIDSETNYEADYPEVSYEVLPGAETSGILVFPAMENKPFTLVIDSYSDDFELTMEPFKFEVK